jgi:hypothetical protein
MRLAITLACTLAIAACSSNNGEEHYDNLPDCVTDHVSEGLSEQHAITHCLYDFPDIHPAFPTIQSCVDFVTDPANGGFSTDEAMAACDDLYVQADAGP